MSIKLITKAWETNFKGNDLLVLLSLADNSSDEGYCFPSWNSIMKKTKVSKATLSYILKSFEHFGILERNLRKREDGSNTSNQYNINIIDVNISEYNQYRKSLNVKKDNHSSETELPTTVQKLNYPSSECELAPSSECELAILTVNNKPSIEPSDKEKDKKEIPTILELWNNLAAELNLNKISKITSKRKAKLSTRLSEDKNFLDDFKTVIENIKLSGFLQGKNNRNWKVDFDWLISNDTNFVKVLEGKYSDNKSQAQQTDFSKFGKAPKSNFAFDSNVSFNQSQQPKYLEHLEQ
jgi:hypothetical protein